MSQNNLHDIIRQQQEQMAAMQAQIQALLAAVGTGGGIATGSNTGAHMEVAKPAIFNGEAGKVGGFISACKLYIRNRMRGDTVEGQVQWVLSYVQGGRTMEEFVQEFKRAARGSGYEGRPLMEEFKRGMNGGIRRKLMEAENPPASIEQWYKRATALDRNWRESRREEERLRGKKEGGGGAQKQERQSLP